VLHSFGLVCFRFGLVWFSLFGVDARVVVACNMVSVAFTWFSLFLSWFGLVLIQLG